MSMEDARAIIEAVEAIPTPVERGDLYLVKEGCEIRVVDLAPHADNPRRRIGTLTADDAATFLALLDRFGHSHSSIWGDARNRIFTIVLDENAGALEGDPQWREWRVKWALDFSNRYKPWREIAGETLTQQQFAEWIEDHAHEVTNISAADLLELAQTFQAHRSATFRSSNMLRDGSTSLHYVDETVQAAAGRAGDISIPAALEVAAPIYAGGDVETFAVRFRWRLRDGKLSITLVIAQQAELEEEAFLAIGKTIGAAAEKRGFAVWNGSPQ